MLLQIYNKVQQRPKVLDIYEKIYLLKIDCGYIFFNDKYIVKQDITKKTLTAIAPWEKFTKKSKRVLLLSRNPGNLRL